MGAACRPNRIRRRGGGRRHCRVARDRDRLARGAPRLPGQAGRLRHGNHEHYRGVVEDRLEEGLATARRTGIHFLNASTVTLDGVRFAGAALWTDFALYGDREWALHAAGTGMNDYRLIRRRACTPGQKGRLRLNTQDPAWSHEPQRRFLAALHAPKNH